MSNTSGKRVGLYLSTTVSDRLKERTETLGLGPTEIFSALITVSTDEEIKDLVTRYRTVRDLEKATAQALSKKMLDLVKGKSAADLQKILDAANGAA